MNRRSVTWSKNVHPNRPCKEQCHSLPSPKSNLKKSFWRECKSTPTIAVILFHIFGSATRLKRFCNLRLTRRSCHLMTCSFLFLRLCYRWNLGANPLSELNVFGRFTAHKAIKTIPYCTQAVHYSATEIFASE